MLFRSTISTLGAGAFAAAVSAQQPPNMDGTVRTALVGLVTAGIVAITDYLVRQHAEDRSSKRLKAHESVVTREHQNTRSVLIDAIHHITTHGSDAKPSRKSSRKSPRRR